MNSELDSNDTKSIIENDPNLLVRKSSKRLEKWEKIKTMTAKYLKKNSRTKSRDGNSQKINYRRKINQTKSIDLTLNEAIKKFFPLPITPLTIFQKQSPSTVKIDQKLNSETRKKINSCRIDGKKRRKNFSFSGGKFTAENFSLKFGSKKSPSLANNIMIYQQLILNKENKKKASLSANRKHAKDLSMKRKNKGRILFEEDDEVKMSIPLKIQ